MQLNGHSLTLTEIAAVAYGREIVQVSSSAHPRILASRKVIDDIVARDAVVYGVNTGFGKLADVRIEHDELRHLQLNLVRSHACGIGPPLAEPEVRAMMLLRANVRLQRRAQRNHRDALRNVEPRSASRDSGERISRSEWRSRSARTSRARFDWRRRIIF